MAYIYSLVLLLVHVAGSPWLAYRALFRGKWRGHCGQRWLGLAPRRSSGKPRVWFHAVSVGEVHLLKSVIERLHRDRPDWEVVLSSTTSSGYAVARRIFPHLDVFYAPIDFQWAVAAAFRRLAPSLLVLSELELWPNLIKTAHRRTIPVAVVNGRMSDKSFRGYRRFRWLVGSVFEQLDWVGVQNETYGDRFRQLGVPPQRLTTTGSIKYDRAPASREIPVADELRTLAGFTQQDFVFVAGSTQQVEELFAANTYRQLKAEFPQLRLVIAPRHVERAPHIQRTMESMGLAVVPRSRLSEASTVDRNQVILVDTLGELSGWWCLADVAFVGGSFGRRGGQNMIEPASVGVPVCFGPNTRNFRETVSSLLERDAAVQLASAEDLVEMVRRCLTEPAWAAGLGDRAQRFIAGQRGATGRTVERLIDLVPDAGAHTPSGVNRALALNGSPSGQS